MSRGPGVCMSNKSPGKADVPGLGIHSGNHSPGLTLSRVHSSSGIQVQDSNIQNAAAPLGWETGVEASPTGRVWTRSWQALVRTEDHPAETSSHVPYLYQASIMQIHARVGEML